MHFEDRQDRPRTMCRMTLVAHDLQQSPVATETDLSPTDLAKFSYAHAYKVACECGQVRQVMPNYRLLLPPGSILAAYAYCLRDILGTTVPPLSW